MKRSKNLFYLIAFVGLIVVGCNSKDKQSEMTKKIVFLISEDENNYEADRSIPVYARQLEENYNFQVDVLLGEGPRTAYEFPNLSLVKDADLLVVFCRRLALPQKQMAIIKDYIQNGNPVLGIRTANHAFSIMGDTIEPGYADWHDFVPEVLGCKNRGYGPVEPGTDISVVSGQTHHPILQGIDENYWHTIGNVYKVAPLLDSDATILLTGNSEDLSEPVAWTRKNNFGGDVFYTSLGHPADFENPDYIKILNQAIAWLTHKNN